MSEAIDNHGNTAAAWTAVTILLIASLVIAFGVGFSNAGMFWSGWVLVVVGTAAGYLMSRK